MKLFTELLMGMFKGWTHFLMVPGITAYYTQWTNINTYMYHLLTVHMPQTAHTTGNQSTE